MLVAAACGLGASGAEAEGGGINWVENLPPLDVAGDVQPGPVPNCKKPKMKCVRVTMKRMRELQSELGCDHRAVFATTYLTLTETYYELLRKQPDFIEDRKYLFTEVAQFANYYFRTLHANARGEEVPPAWDIALDTARDADVNGAQDMLLGINAHVQSDMAFVIAELGLETPDGKSRKPDHDVVNAVLEMAYQRVVDEVERRYDPYLAFTNRTASPPTTPPASSWSAPGARTSGETPSASPTPSPRTSAARSPTRSSRTRPSGREGIAALRPRRPRPPGRVLPVPARRSADGLEGQAGLPRAQKQQRIRS